MVLVKASITSGCRRAGLDLGGPSRGPFAFPGRLAVKHDVSLPLAGEGFVVLVLIHHQVLFAVVVWNASSAQPAIRGLSPWAGHTSSIREEGSHILPNALVGTEPAWSSPVERPWRDTRRCEPFLKSLSPPSSS